MKTIPALLVSLTVAVFQLAPSHGAVPQLINYQGRLVDLGPPLPPYWATFWIYDAPTNGTLLWGPETHDLALQPGGLFTVELGTTNLLQAAVFSGTNAYLEIAVQGTVLAPRTRIVTTPYAFQAQQAQQLSWAERAVTVDANSISTDDLQDLAVKEAKISLGAVTTPRLADRAVTTDKLADGAVTTAKIAPGTSVDMVDGFPASDQPPWTAGILVPLDSAAKFPNAVLRTGHGNGLDADTVDGKHASDLLLATPPITITGDELFGSWILKLVNTGTQATGITLIATNDFGAGIVAGSGHGGPGVRGVALGGADGYFFGVEGIGGGGVRGEAVIPGSGTNTSDLQYGVLGYSDRGVGVKAQSISGKALIVDGTAEFNGSVLFKGGLSGQINGDMITDQTIDGTKLLPGGSMDQGPGPAGAFLWKFSAASPGTAAPRTETTAGTNGVALHSVAGLSGIGAPDQPIGMLGESDQGYAMVAQAAGGVGIKATSTSGIGVLAQAAGPNALALQALGQSDFEGAIPGALAHFNNAISNSPARVHALIGEVTGLPGGNEPVIGVLGRAGTNNQALGPIKIGVQGETDSGFGLVGTSAGGTAVWARSGSGAALLAESASGIAIQATGHSSAGVIGESSLAPGLVGLSGSGPGVAAQNASTTPTVAATNTSSGDAVFGYSANGVGLHAKSGGPGSNALLVEGASRLNGSARFQAPPPG